MAPVLSDHELKSIDAYWRAANYLSVGQIYLYDNPLLREPLRKELVKPRLLGHWGTTPGLNFLYVHLNRVIKKDGLNMIYITGPGHGGPGLVANAYLEGTYSEVYPNITPMIELSCQVVFKASSYRCVAGQQQSCHVFMPKIDWSNRTRGSVGKAYDSCTDPRKFGTDFKRIPATARKTYLST